MKILKIFKDALKLVKKVFCNSQYYVFINEKSDVINSLKCAKPAHSFCDPVQKKKHL